MGHIQFPKSFIWGTASSSYQIEGSPLADGASPSIWHAFSHKPGKTHNGDTGDIACDHYNRYPEDIGHMKELGINAYRFSVNWPRVVPEPGKVNEQGLAFYNKLVDALLANGINPYLTLFHWETPQWLEDKGGFVTREAVDHFLFYSETMFSALGDRVKKWITVNEPMVYSFYGYGLGKMAPGYKFNLKRLFHATHHLLLAHAETCSLYKTFSSGTEEHIGIAENQIWIRPSRSDNGKDKETAELMDSVLNRFYIDPVINGTYPEIALSKVGKFMPAGFEQDLSRMTAPFDFIGINYYTKQDYRFAPLAPYFHQKEVPDSRGKRSAMWDIYPEGIYNLLKRVKEKYGNIPCYITENGYPLVEAGEPVIEDDDRIEYLSNHIKAAHQAMEEGVQLKGYFHWTLMDNFEWHLGNAMRFGLIRVDFFNQERRWKKSAHWYKKLVETGKLET